MPEVHGPRQSLCCIQRLDRLSGSQFDPYGRRDDPGLWLRELFLRSAAGLFSWRFRYSRHTKSNDVCKCRDKPNTSWKLYEMYLRHELFGILHDQCGDPRVNKGNQRDDLRVLLPCLLISGVREPGLHFQVT